MLNLTNLEQGIKKNTCQIFAVWQRGGGDTLQKSYIQNFLKNDKKKMLGKKATEPNVERQSWTNGYTNTFNLTRLCILTYRSLEFSLTKENKENLGFCTVCNAEVSPIITDK